MPYYFEAFLSQHQIDPMDMESFRYIASDDFAAQHARYPYDDFDEAYIDLWKKQDFNGHMQRYANEHCEVLG